MKEMYFIRVIWTIHAGNKKGFQNVYVALVFCSSVSASPTLRSYSLAKG